MAGNKGTYRDLAGAAELFRQQYESERAPYMVPQFNADGTMSGTLTDSRKEDNGARTLTAYKTYLQTGGQPQSGQPMSLIEPTDQAGTFVNRGNFNPKDPSMFDSVMKMLGLGEPDQPQYSANAPIEAAPPEENASLQSMFPTLQSILDQKKVDTRVKAGKTTVVAANEVASKLGANAANKLGEVTASEGKKPTTVLLVTEPYNGSPAPELFGSNKTGVSAEVYRSKSLNRKSITYITNDSTPADASPDVATNLAYRLIDHSEKTGTRLYLTGNTVNSPVGQELARIATVGTPDAKGRSKVTLRPPDAASDATFVTGTIPQGDAIPAGLLGGMNEARAREQGPNVIGKMARFYSRDLPAKIDETFGVPQAGFDAGQPLTDNQKTFENQPEWQKIVGQIDRTAMRGVTGALGFVPSLLNDYGLGGPSEQGGKDGGVVDATKNLVTSTGRMFTDAAHQAAYTFARAIGKSPEEAVRWGTTDEGLIEARKEAVRRGMDAPESPIFAVLMGKGAVEGVSPKTPLSIAEQIKALPPVIEHPAGQVPAGGKVEVTATSPEPQTPLRTPTHYQRTEPVSPPIEVKPVETPQIVDAKLIATEKPVADLPPSSNVGVETNVSTLSLRTEADAIEAKLTKDFGDLPEYKTMNMGEQARDAQKLIESDHERAKRIAMGDETPPVGLREASVYEAVKIRAIKDGDVETLQKLATESTVPGKLSAYGQAIKAADSELMSDPVRVMQDIAKVRQSYSERTGQRYSVDVISSLRKKLADTEDALSKRISQKVPRKEPAPYGSRNRVVTAEAYQKARAELEGYLSTASSGVNPIAIGRMTQIGAYHLEAGTRVFADWSAKMVEDVGEKVKPYLDQVWKKVQDDKRIQIAIKSQKTRLGNEAQTYREKLANLDLTPKVRRTIQFDVEALRLKQARDVAKRNYEAAVNAFGSVTKEEATNIVHLSERMTQKMGEMEKGGDRLEYGAARVSYENYVNHLKGEQAPIRTIVKGGMQKFQTTWRDNRSKAVYDLALDGTKIIVNNSVSMVASLDNSFLGRQGLHTLQTHPTIWANAARNSFVDIAKTLGGKNAHDALMADVYSRPNYLNGSYEKAGILTKVEEQYPTSLPERIPGAGRLFKASENAFTGSAIRMRTGLYDLLSEKAASNGVDMTDAAQIKPLGKMINALTARGQWGKRGEPAVIRLVMWAPKMLKGNIDVLTAHGAGMGLESSFARKEAAINLLKVVGETATVIMIAKALKPGSAETDPRSSLFGKIKVGRTSFDITGGAGGIVTLASRLISNSYKQTSTGKVVPYSTKFGQPTAWDALVDFVANKSNPPAHVAINWLKGEGMDRKPFSFAKEAYRAQTPISIQQAIQLKDNASADAVAGVILDGLGINANTYQNTKNVTSAGPTEQQWQDYQRRKKGQK